MHFRLRRKAYQKEILEEKNSSSPGMIYGAKGEIDNRVILLEGSVIWGPVIAACNKCKTPLRTEG
jgi:hypothetical protein